MFLNIGCSSGGSNPVQTELNNQGDGTGGDGQISVTTDLTTPQDAEDIAREVEDSTGLFPWGLYEVTWDSASNQVVIVPLRTAETAFNILRFLQPPDGDKTCLGITVTDASQFISDGILGLDVSIKHPFTNSVLTGFDVMGVVIGHGSIISDQDPGVLYAGDENLLLLNADGYSRWMNPSEFTQSGLLGYTEGVLGTKDVEFTATINGYKYFAENITSTQTVEEYLALAPNVDNRGAFLPESIITRNYTLKFPMVGGSPEVRFQYAVLARWDRAKDLSGAPIPDPVIDDFPPEANIAEAVHAAVDPSGSTAYYIDDTNKGGDLILDIIIVDWQGELSPEGVVDQVSELVVEAPSGMITGGAASFSTMDLLGAQTSSGPTFSQMTLEIPDVSPSGPDEEILIIIRSSDPTDYDTGGSGGEFCITICSDEL